MFDLLLDPAFIAVFGSITGGVGLKFIEKRTAKKVTRKLQGEFVIQHEKKKEIDPSTSIYACKVYSDRLFEYKLVESGALALVDMTVCDAFDCVYCKDTREAQSEVRRDKHREAVAKSIEHQKSEQQKFAELKAKDSRYKGYRFEDYVLQQKLRQHNERLEAVEKKRFNAEQACLCMTCDERGIHTHTQANSVPHIKLRTY